MSVMIEFVRYKKNIKIKEIYFFSEKEYSGGNDCDVLFFIQSRYPIFNTIEFENSHINLRDNVEMIFSRFKKNTKYEINRAKKSDGWMCFIDINPSLDLISDCITKYNNFALKKGLEKANEDKILHLKKSNALCISVNQINKSIFVIHLYIQDGIRARLLYSFNYCNDINCEGIENIVARGNRMLHWEDIQFFKERNFEIYDFGGAGTKNPKVMSITKFKKDFGGSDIIEYTSVKGLTIRGKIAEIYFKYKFK